MSVKGDKVIKKRADGTIYVVQPEYIKRQAVRKLEAGLLTINEAKIKYEVTGKQTIRNWLIKYSSDGEKYFPKHPLDKLLIKKIIRELDMGLLTAKEAAIYKNTV